MMENEKVKGNNDELAGIYAVICWCNVIEKGPLDLLFGTEALLPPQQEEQEQQQEVETPTIVEQIERRGLQERDITSLVGQVDIDDDNEPAPENIPTRGNNNNNNNNENKIFNEWGHDGVCQRCTVGGVKEKAKLIDFSSAAGMPALLDIFEAPFPKEFITSTIIIETNKKLNDKKLSYGEFLVWLGLWFMMGTTHFGD